MSATVAITRAAVPGDRRANEVTITGDASYATGGYAVTATQFGLTRLDGIDCLAAVSGKHVIYDSGTGKVLFITTATGAEVSNASNQSAVVIPVYAQGV